MDEWSGIKLAIGGKGGVGKTTLAACLAHLYLGRGYEVVAIDADPDSNLAGRLGHPEPERLVTVSSLKSLIRERTGAGKEGYGALLKLNPDVSDVVDTYGTEIGGVQFLALGTFTKGGTGCACPESAFLRSLMNHVVLHRNQVAILDMEAGIEHLGRSTVAGVDALLVVVEPSLASVQTARVTRGLAQDIGLKRVGVVVNKVRGEAQLQRVQDMLGDMALLGWLGYDAGVQEADLSGQVAFEVAPKLVRQVDQTIDHLGEWIGKPVRGAGRAANGGV